MTWLNIVGQFDSFQSQLSERLPLVMYIKNEGTKILIFFVNLAKQHIASVFPTYVKWWCDILQPYFLTVVLELHNTTIFFICLQSFLPQDMNSVEIIEFRYLLTSEWDGDWSCAGMKHVGCCMAVSCFVALTIMSCWYQAGFCCAPLPRPGFVGCILNI